MKTLLYTLLLLLSLTAFSCRSVEKLVDQGRYDEAIVLATKKLAGKKNKKTKHIKALEKAFAKINQHDLSAIESMKLSNDPSTWDDVYNYLVRIEARQETVFPFLPIVSKEGYVGSFDLIDTKYQLREAAQAASAYRYDKGLKLLTEAKNTLNRLSAQEAYYVLKGIRRYNKDYKDAEQLLQESKDLGTFRVLLQHDSNFENFHIPFNPRTLRNSAWTHIDVRLMEEAEYDFLARLTIDDVHIGPEQESSNNFIERKEIETWEDAFDRDGNLVTDSLGNVIQVKRTDKFTAYVSEIIRSKYAQFNAKMEIVDFYSGDQLFDDFFSYNTDFYSDACTFQGDREALADGVIKRLDHTLLPFPSDYEMTVEALNNIYEKFYFEIGRLNFADMYHRDLTYND